MIALLIPVFLVLFTISSGAVAEGKAGIASNIVATFTDEEIVQFYKLRSSISKILDKAKAENRKPIELTDEQMKVAIDDIYAISGTNRNEIIDMEDAMTLNNILMLPSKKAALALRILNKRERIKENGLLPKTK
jgi:predicted GTPase